MPRHHRAILKSRCDHFTLISVQPFELDEIQHFAEEVIPQTK